jgi:tetratricopeptide (TPR) repeat protein
MDDKPNILNNTALHIKDLKPENLWQTFFANQGKKAEKLYRPLPCLSFAINWYIGKDNPFGYHMVNMSIHIISAWLLYLLILNLLNIYYTNQADKKEAITGIAMLAAVLWAINPIHTQAVTYVVQRMAIMATLFYLLGMISYLKLRTTKSLQHRLISALSCFIWFLCSIGSKENAILFPFSLLLTEWIFIQKAHTDFLSKSNTFLFVFLSLTLVILLFLFSYYHEIIQYFSHMYSSWKRPFTLEERLLAQPRIVLSYLTQLFYPIPSRLSIEHDIILNKSLFYPWQTLPAIGIIIAALFFAFKKADRFPMVSFAIIFYFLNHIIESSFIPLELVFEHRNYLPSLFLFLPVAYGLVNLLNKLFSENILIYIITYLTIILLIVSLGLGTYTRNMTWQTELTLWFDAAKKAPKSLRPQVYIAQILAWEGNHSINEYQRALAIYEKSFEYTAARTNQQAKIIGDMAAINYHMGNFEKAVELFEKAREIEPGLLKLRFDMIKPLVMMGRFDEAMVHARYIVNKRPKNYKYNNYMGFILLWKKQPRDALSYFQRALFHGPKKANLFLNTGVALTQLGSYQNGQWFLKFAAKKEPKDLHPIFALIENRIKANDIIDATKICRQMIADFTTPKILTMLEFTIENYRSAPVDVPLISELIKKELNVKVTK